MSANAYGVSSQAEEIGFRERLRNLSSAAVYPFREYIMFLKHCCQVRIRCTDDDKIVIFAGLPDRRTSASAVARGDRLRGRSSRRGLSAAQAQAAGRGAEARRCQGNCQG